MKTIKNKVLLILMFLLTISCDDIIEKDISDKMVTVISPLDGAEIESNVVTFQWNRVDGTEKYRVQVFREDQAMILDSLVSNSSLTHPILQGSYQWRVRGENFAYESAYSFPVRFTVIETSDLTNQQILLSSPSNSFYTNSTSLICSWQAISAADYYELQLVNMTTGQNIVYEESNILSTSATLNPTSISSDGEYQWKIKGVNDTSQTPFATRTFFIDRVSPNLPINLLPGNNSIQLASQTLSFTWNQPSDTGTIQSPIVYTIEFAHEISFASLIQSSNTSNTSFDQIMTLAGEYYWRVKASDSAGNVGTYSAPFKFTIN